MNIRQEQIDILKKVTSCFIRVYGYCGYSYEEIFMIAQEGYVIRHDPKWEKHNGYLFNGIWNWLADELIQYPCAKKRKSANTVHLDQVNTDNESEAIFEIPYYDKRINAIDILDFISEYRGNISKKEWNILIAYIKSMLDRKRWHGPKSRSMDNGMQRIRRKLKLCYNSAIIDNVYPLQNACI